MRYEVKLTMLIDSPFDNDRVAVQVESLFAFGSIRESLAAGLELLEDPRLLDVAVAPPPADASRGA